MSEGGFDKSCYRLEWISEHAAKTFCRDHHYAAGFPAAIHRIGVVERRTAQLVGAIVFGAPVNEAVLRNPFPTLRPYVASVELSRLCLLDEVPANAESWAVAGAFRMIHGCGVRGVVSFSDPVPRASVGGRPRLPGHVGTTYQALGADYAGRGTARSLTLLRDGSVLNDRSAQKVRKQEQGHEYVERRLLELGAVPRRAGQDPAGWLGEAVSAAGGRRLRHQGPHRYLFRLGSARERRGVPIGVPVSGRYPKQIDDPPTTSSDSSSDSSSSGGGQRSRSRPVVETPLA